MEPNPKTDRRDFLKGAAAIPLLAGLASRAEAQQPARFNGIQMGPQTMLDEGLDHCLDLIQDTAAINAILVYSHNYDELNKPPQVLAHDHGVPVRDMRTRKLPAVWVHHHDEAFKNTTLRHQRVDSSFEYSDRDIFAELVEPCRKRGMKLYARILEDPGHVAQTSIANFSKVLTVDVHGRAAAPPCWNHPAYRAFWIATVEDMFRTYQLDGLQWGAERHGPLMNLFFQGRVPFCFCDYCRARGRAHGIDPERARKGFENLYDYVQAMMTGKSKPADGVFVGALRVLIRYPEILSWEYQYRQSREEMEQALFKAVKATQPEAQVGWHISHQQSSYDLVYRAEMSYAEMAPYSDFIKIIAYHDVLGPRIRWWYLDRLSKTVLGEVPLNESLDLYYDLFGYDKNVEPKLNELATKGFSPDYVFRETKHSVASAEGKTKIYTGVGFDVPYNNNHIDADPEEVYQCVMKSFEAGAKGIVVSREYEEMRVPNLKAVGRAIRALS
ncbi:MAG TPA: twin-arginine translocation signal domain-containing protein [Bryobacteraceae bacterium]|nr:twin-arginine translocation signal domain-containing protein [Bryobacteraceae bacterium]